MKSLYRLTAQARKDVRDIWRHISADNPDAADSMVDLFTSTYKMLARSPNVGANLSHLRPGLRAFPVRRYVIFFAPTADGVDVYRVLHGARDWESMVRRADWPDPPAP